MELVVSLAIDLKEGVGEDPTKDLVWLPEAECESILLH